MDVFITHFCKDKLEDETVISLKNPQYYIINNNNLIHHFKSIYFSA